MLTFRFKGGFLDGLEASSTSTNSLEKQYYLMCMNFTEGGVIGQGFDTNSPIGMQQALKIENTKERLAAIKNTMHHRYTATERTKEGDHEIVTLTLTEHNPG